MKLFLLLPLQNSFVLVGGGTSTVSPDFVEAIVRYDPILDDWEVLEQRLPNPDYVNVAALAPRGFNVSCTLSSN